jgi:predicted adenine nucleotide alpha hydrolase (AANH) superfamily ATPase
MVAHLCCSVDAGYFLKKLQEEYPDEKIIGYFYDPNIHPYSEFKLRSLDTKRICEKLGVEYIEGEYDYENWLKAVKGKEFEPEKGSRCSICFDHSLEATAIFAKKIGDNKITTSLLMSPMKSQAQLASIGKIIKRKYGIDFLVVDYRKKGGTQAQQKFAKENQLYRQDYCGCIYGIWQQKKNQEIIDELISPYPFQILLASIEERLEFYKNRIELEERGVSYKIVKESFLNYRLLFSRITYKDNGVKNLIHYTLFYSHLDRKQRVRIEFVINDVGYTNRANILFITVKKVNRILNKTYESVKDLYNTPLNLEEELKIREFLTKTTFNLSPIIVVDELIDKTMDVEINSKIYPDTREILI